MYSIETFTKDEKNNTQTITTLEIAEMMDIEHWQVLRKLEGREENGKHIKGYVEVLADNQMVVSNFFALSSYRDASGKENKCYNVTKLGCDFLANKFTGEKGILFTAKYVKRFNEMEQELKPKSSAEMLLMYAQQFYEQEKRLNAVEDKIKQIDAKVTTHSEDYYTIAGYASLRGIKVDINKANMLGRKASNLSREYGYDIGNAKDVRFGTVNTYHADILKEVFKR